MDKDPRRRKFESEQRIKAARAAGQCAMAFHRIADLLRSLGESETPYSAAELETILFQWEQAEQHAESA